MTSQQMMITMIKPYGKMIKFCQFFKNDQTKITFLKALGFKEWEGDGDILHSNMNNLIEVGVNELQRMIRSRIDSKLDQLSWLTVFLQAEITEARKPTMNHDMY